MRDFYKFLEILCIKITNRINLLKSAFNNSLLNNSFQFMTKQDVLFRIILLNLFVMKFKPLTN